MKWYWWALGALIIAGGGKIVYDQTRGLRNNNPGNIRKSGDNWYGLAPKQTDSQFFQFSNAKYGIRALGKILLNYERLYYLDTVRKIITRWAPGHENPTASYVDYVARKIGVGADDVISVRSHLADLTKAIISFENGFNPYSDGVINEGLAMV